MSGLGFEDKTGQPTTAREALEAEKVVTEHMLDMSFMMKNPKLAVMLPTIRRVCIEYAEIAQRLERSHD